MPHKHTRREKDPSTFDLPPSQIAKPLPVTSLKQRAQAAKSNDANHNKAPKRKRGQSTTDDVPRAFKRLMAFAGGKKTRNGLDDGNGAGGKKQKKTQKESSTTEEEVRPDVPTIRPGEKLADYSRRVDAALPLSGLVTKTVKNGVDPLGLKVRRTRKEKKMHKLYDEWREEDRKIKEKREEELELAEERELENDALGVSWKVAFGEESSGGKNKKKKKNKRGRYVGEAADREEDPWEEIKKKRGESKIGLHDVALAPPEFSKLPRKKITIGGAVVDVGSVPKAAGSLRRREELQEVREQVVANYRKKAEEKRSALQG